MIRTWIRNVGLSGLLVGVMGCGQTTHSEKDRFEQLFSGGMQIVDLTHSLASDGPFWPNPEGNPFRHEVLRAHPSGAASMARYSTPEHHGTHLDAPIHSADGQLSVDQLATADLFGPAAVVDVSSRSATAPDYQLSRQDLLDWETRHGRLPEGAIVLMFTGWSRKWDEPDDYRNQDDEGRMHFPGFSEEASRFLIEERVIAGIGIDTLSVDAANAAFDTHRTVNGSGKFHLENVANLHLLPESGAYLIVAPIKIQGGSGGQVRIFAAIP